MLHDSSDKGVRGLEHDVAEGIRQKSSQKRLFLRREHLAGTYSSIFIGSPLLVTVEKWQRKV